MQVQSRFTERYRVRFPCEPSAIRAVRADAARKLAEWALAESTVDDALTLVSELTTNAVRHAGAVPGAWPDPAEPSFFLDLSVVANLLYVAVHDGNDQVPVVQPSSEDVETGRGLRMVASLTDGTWGFYHRLNGPGKVVWAALRLEVEKPAISQVEGQAAPARPSPFGAGFRARVFVAARLCLLRRYGTGLGSS